MTQSPKPSGQPNPSLEELRSINRNLTAIKDELIALRADMKKPPNIMDQVAKGVVLAGVFWFVIFFVLQIMFSL